jgi:hypothetical protein
VRRDHDHRNVETAARQLVLKLKTIHFGHPQIEDETLQDRARKGVEELTRRSVGVDGKAGGADQAGKRLERGCIVVDGDTYDGFRHDVHCSKAPAAGADVRSAGSSGGGDAVPVAIAKCQAGDTATGIPVLEKVLKDNKVALPPRE